MICFYSFKGCIYEENKLPAQNVQIQSFRGPHFDRGTFVEHAWSKGVAYLIKYDSIVNKLT